MQDSYISELRDRLRELEFESTNEVRSLKHAFEEERARLERQARETIEPLRVELRQAKEDLGRLQEFKLHKADHDAKLEELRQELDQERTGKKLSACRSKSRSNCFRPVCMTLSVSLCRCTACAARREEVLALERKFLIEKKRLVDSHSDEYTELKRRARSEAQRQLDTDTKRVILDNKRMVRWCRLNSRYVWRCG